MGSGENAIFEPKRVALVGVYELKEAPEYGVLFQKILQNMSKFKKFYPVDLCGKLSGCEKKIDKIPKGSDIVGVVLPERLLAKNFRKIVSRGRSIIIFTREISPKLGAEIKKLKKVFVVGPASLGVINQKINLALTYESLPPEGSIALISQREEITSEILEKFRKNGVGVGKALCIGEGTDVGGILEYLANDKRTSGVCLHVQNGVNGRRLAEKLSSLSSRKPVLVFKSDFASRVFRSAIKQSGGMFIEGIESFVAGAKLLGSFPLGKKVIVLTNSAVRGKIALKLLESRGFSFVQPSEKISKALSKKISAVIDVEVLLPIFADTEKLKICADILSNDEASDFILLVFRVLHSCGFEEIDRFVSKIRKIKGKPIILCVFAPEELRSKIESLPEVFTDLKMCVGGLDVVSRTRSAKRS